MLNPLKNLVQKSTIRAYSSIAKAKPIPSPRGKFTDIASLFKPIKEIASVADKFTSWEQAFKSSRLEMKELGLTPQQRKKVFMVTHNFRFGIDPVAEKKHKCIPKRQSKK